MDEPCSALDPIATTKIEQLIAELKTQFPIFIITHACSRQRAFPSHPPGLIPAAWSGSGAPNRYSSPRHQLTEIYSTGRFG
ncbi:MAG: hypothetical protein P8X39_06000 [Desulfofustis sp.]